MKKPLMFADDLLDVGASTVIVFLGLLCATAVIVVLGVWYSTDALAAL
jgi:hypothetical protein